MRMGKSQLITIQLDNMNEIGEVMKKIKQIKDLGEAKIRHKELKRQILKLEIWVILISIFVICQIVLSFFGILNFNLGVIGMIIFGVLLIVNAFKDGEVLELEKFFIELIFLTKDNKDSSE